MIRANKTSSTMFRFMWTYYSNENMLVAELDTDVFKWQFTSEARYGVVMSRPLLGLLCIPNTESTPGVESRKQYPATDHKIVHFAPVHFSGTLVRLGWLLLVHEICFHTYLYYLIFSINTSKNASNICIVTTLKSSKSNFCKPLHFLVF